MRQITDHWIEGGSEQRVDVRAIDKPGEGGASHKYKLLLVAAPGSEAPIAAGAQDLTIEFQNGPLKGERATVNGVTNEALLAVVLDRLRGFQSGKFMCEENNQALLRVRMALNWLQKRTVKRMKRGVEGKREK